MGFCLIAVLGNWYEGLRTLPVTGFLFTTKRKHSLTIKPIKQNMNAPIISHTTEKLKYRLSPSTIEKLQYYVYSLSDPLTGDIFYIGKGCGNRINHHLLGALDENTKESEKIKKIRDIKNAGLEVKLDIIRHGLTEKESFEVESALIDTIGMDNLTNIVLGHHSDLRGKMTLRDIEIEYQAQPAEFDEPVILIRINKAFRRDMKAEELYQVTRKDWKVGQRIFNIKIACAVYAGIIREVYSVKEWVPSTDCLGRYMFNGEIAEDNIRSKYINKSVAHVWKQGSQNPIKYVD
jgi:hypothetical protein